MNKDGQTTVEFALAVVLLFTLFFALTDFVLMFYVNLTMHHAVREGARNAITGQPGDSRAALIQKIRDCSNGLYDQNASADKDPTVAILTPSDTNLPKYSGTLVSTGTGQPDQIIIVSLTYSWPLVTPMLAPFFTDSRYTFTAQTTMKNENWGP